MTSTLTNTSYDIRAISRKHKIQYDGTKIILPYGSDRCTLIWETLYCVSSADDIHERHSRNFAYPPAKFAIARCNDIAFVRRNALHEAVVGIGA